MLKRATAADFFGYREDPGPAGDARRRAFEDMIERQQQAGAQCWRMTIVVDGDGTGYPPGLWLEGWRDPHPNQLPFGASEEPGGPAFPPLTTVPA